MRELVYSPTGERDGEQVTYACNMRWIVLNEHGRVIYRGPEWRASMIAAGDSLTFGEAWINAGGKTSELLR